MNMPQLITIPITIFECNVISRAGFSPFDDLNTQDKVGNTPLMIACAEGLVGLATHLINHPEIDLKARAMHDLTALSWCI